MLKAFITIPSIIIYSLIFAEFFVRIFNPQAFVPRHVIAAPYGVRANLPNATYEHRTPEMSAVVRINSQGLRASRIYPVQKATGISRIVLLGDSYFLGYEGDYEDIVATQLERELQEANCSVEILNFSVSGFGTAEMLRTLEAKAMKFDPDIVIFQWHHTDPDDNIRANLYELNDGVLHATGNAYVPAVSVRRNLADNPIYRFLSKHSHLFIALREKTSRTVRRALAGHVFNRNTAGGGAAETSERIASATDLALLGKAESLSNQFGSKFFVVDVPGVQSRTRFRTSFRLLPETLTNRKNYISPIDEFEEAASEKTKLYWEKGHKHLTPLGNKIVAEKIAKTFLSDADTRKVLGCGPVQASERIARR